VGKQAAGDHAAGWCRRRGLAGDEVDKSLAECTLVREALLYAEGAHEFADDGEGRHEDFDAFAVKSGGADAGIQRHGSERRDERGHTPRGDCAGLPVEHRMTDGEAAT
jgi:hypothetical protein